MDDSNLIMSLENMFPEPERPPTPEATTSVYLRERKDLASATGWSSLKISLVGSHPLWAHHLWNAARALASFLDSNQDLYKAQAVLELGAGGGLPGIVAAKNGAKQVLLTDYPDNCLIENMRHNIEANFSTLPDNIETQGYIWGRDVQPLIRHEKFKLIILSDLIFNHSQHVALMQTCQDALAPQGVVLVFYTHHRPHLADRDIQFFEIARTRGWQCEEILTRQYDPMFPEDSGDSEVRGTVHGWTLKRDLPMKESK